MKNRSVVNFLLLCSLFVLGNCKKNDDPTKSPEELQLGLLAKPWSIQTASLDGVDRTDNFKGMSLLLSGTFVAAGTYNFDVSGSRQTPSPWPTTGTWKFGADVMHDMLRNPGSEDLAMNYTVSANELNISFTCQTCNFVGARTNLVNGKWIFVFNSTK